MFQQSVSISANRPITKEIFLLSFLAPALSRSARPGQFLHLLPECRPPLLLRRPFSIHDAREGVLSVLYRVIGKGTSFLSSLKKGQKMEVLGPLGHGFQMKERFSDHLVVAGGMGLAPMRFLVRHLSMAKLRHATYYGCSGRSELLPCPGKRKVLTTDDGSCGRRGFVTEALLEDLKKHQRPAVYACGPWPMLRRLARICQERNIDCQVSLEAFMACGVGACQGCVVKGVKGYLTVCHDGPVFDAREIDWEHDIDL